MRATWFQATVAGLLCVGIANGLAVRRPLVSRLPSSEGYYGMDVLQPRFFTNFQSQRLKIKYGPFTVPPSTKDYGMDTFYLQTVPPCTECLITNIQVGLEYPNGAQANANTNLRLHHALITNLERDSVTCPMLPEPVFASGNERTEANICLNGTQKAGYPLSKTAQLTFTTKLMNTAPEAAQDAVLTIDWEFVPSTTIAAGFHHVTPVWLDIDGTCPQHESEKPVPEPNADRVSFAMDPAWAAGFGGEVLWVLAHLQDGGEELRVMRGEGEVMVCRAEAGYGEGGDLESMSACAGVGRVEAGERWGAQADYDFGKHVAMVEGGKMAPVMGVALMYVMRDGD